MRFVGVLFCFTTTVFAQYTGAAACASCHPQHFKQQSTSEHARALRPALDHPLSPSFVQTAPGYEIVRSAPGLIARVGSNTLPIEWAFGAGDQAVTFVGQIDENRYIEHRYSLYSQIGALGLTPGHPEKLAPEFPASAGDVYQTFAAQTDIMRCFSCHSTGKLSLGTNMKIVPAEPGVWCESCHGPGASHASAMRAGQTAEGRKAMRNPGRMSAVALNEFCGACHRKPSRGVDATNWNDAWNTRHQPVYLAQSACFTKSSGKLSCLTCHDPHQPLKRNASDFYNGKCSSCHGQMKHAAVPGKSTQDCVSCHMPAVAPKEHLHFANHWIGIYQNGQVLKPVRRR